MGYWIIPDVLIELSRTTTMSFYIEMEKRPILIPLAAVSMTGIAAPFCIKSIERLLPGAPMKLTVKQSNKRYLTEGEVIVLVWGQCTSPEIIVLRQTMHQQWWRIVRKNTVEMNLEFIEEETSLSSLEKI